MNLTYRSGSVAAWLALAAALPLAAQQPAPAPAVVQERLDLAVAQRIRDEGLNRSHVDSLAEYLTDVIGPRLTGSTGMRRADEWVTQMLRQTDAQVFKKYSQMKLQMKREALAKLNRKASESGSDTEACA